METTNIAKGTFLMTSTQLIQYLVFALFYVIVAKTNALSPEDLGILSILSFIASTLTISQLNLPNAITKFMSEHLGKGEPEKAAALQRKITILITIVSLMSFIIASVFSSQLSQYFWGTTEKSALIILISFDALFLNLIVFFQSILRVFGLFDKIAIGTLIYVISGRIIAIFLTLLNFGIIGVLFGYIVGSILGLLTLIIFSHNQLPNPIAKISIRPVLNFSLPLTLGSIADFVVNQIDVLIIATFTFNYALLGIYSIVVKSISVLYVVWHPILYTIFPLISAKFGLQDSKGINKVVKMTSRYLAYTVIPSCVLIGAIAPTALEIFYGADYATGATALTILAISITIFAFFKLFITTLTAMGETRQVLKINIILAFATIILLSGFVPIFSVIGAATARLIAYSFALILVIYIIRKYLNNLDIDKEALWKSILASIFFIPFLFVLQSVITKDVSIIMLFISEIIIAGLIYLGVLRFLKALNNDDFDLIIQFFPKYMSKIINFLQKIIIKN